MEAAQKRVESINPAGTLVPLAQAFTKANGRDILENARNKAPIL